MKGHKNNLLVFCQKKKTITVTTVMLSLGAGMMWSTPLFECMNVAYLTVKCVYKKLILVQYLTLFPNTVSFLSLLLYLSADPGLLQQVLLNLGPFYCSSLVEVDVNVFPKTRGVVIANSFGISKG